MRKLYLFTSSVAFGLCLAACEVRVGDGVGPDGGFIFDDEDSGPRRVDAGHDASTPRDDDSGTEAPRVDAGMQPSAAGTGGAPGGSSQEPLPTPTDVAAFIARGRCGALERCMGPLLLPDAVDGNDCVDYVTRQQRDRHLHWLSDSVDAKRVDFHPERLRACETDLVALGCAVNLSRLPASCEEAVEGQVALDAGCNIDQDCRGTDTWCAKGNPEQCPGFCAALQPLGKPCTSGGQCERGLACYEGLCAQPLAEGDTCTKRFGSLECPAGLVCQGPTDELTCRSLQSVYIGKLGETCDAFGQLCAIDLVCQSKTSANTRGVCASPSERGATCKTSLPSACPVGQFCKNTSSASTEKAMPGVDGICSDLPAAGESCENTGRCAPGAHCFEDDQGCYRLQAVGAACTQNADCYSGYCGEAVCEVKTPHCE